MDGTSDRPFILEVFSSSQPEVFSRICPSKSTVLSDGSAATLVSIFHLVCQSLSFVPHPLFHSDLPGVHSDESLSSGRLVALPHKQLRDRDVHHRSAQL